MLLSVKLLQRSVYSSQRCEFEPISSPLLCSERSLTLGYDEDNTCIPSARSLSRRLAAPSGVEETPCGGCG
ncbi:hypothetical protein T06_5265 [Trichinella sp. T6]|nr:hypothetical protein T06_5265 [Trichinella sp. T6]